MINRTYYDNIHYVWCTPYFNIDTLPNIDRAAPPSSSPDRIYLDLYEAIKHKDRHNSRIAQNKLGILNGARIQLKKKIINDEQFKEIAEIIGAAELSDFRPLVYIISYDLVKERLKPVLPLEKAHPFSTEFKVEDLQSNTFDIIEFDG